MLHILICSVTLIINIAVVIGVIGLALGAVFAPWRWPVLFAPRGWVGLVVGIILSFLMYPKCGFLKLPF